MRRLLLSLAAVLALSAAASAQTKPTTDSVLDALVAVTSFRQTSISPDGSRVAWVERRRDAKGQEILSAVFESETAGGKPRRVSAARDVRDHREHSPVWSPDGKSLAFLSDAEKTGQLQIYVSAAGGEARKVTAVTGQISDPRWSPDGRRLSFLFVEGSAQEPGALVAYKLDSGVVEETVEEQRIAVVEVSSGKTRTISPANLYVYDYDWSPDGGSFAAEAAEGSGTNNYWIGELFLVRSDSGATRSVWKPPLQIACPRFSPDGKSIAVIHGIMSDEGSTGGDIWEVPVSPVAGGLPKNLTPDIKASASHLFWRSAEEILFEEFVDGQTGIATLQPSTGKVATLWTGASAVSSLSVARSGAASAAIVQSFVAPPEIHAGPIGAWKALTQANRQAARFWGEPKSLHWSSDGAQVQGWLLPPKDVVPGKTYPMIVIAHGGPSAAAMPAWPARWTAVLPSQGYFIFLPNPRGSYGQGEAFTQGNVKDFGYGDLRDILSGVDEAIKRAPIDGARLGIVGWSYGGYITMWAVTQTHRFQAAVAGAGIVDWQSYYGQNRIDRWMLPFFGASVYEDPGVYAKSSPITFIKNVKTPTLVLHGDRDSEVPTPQGYEFWHALKTLGVPTQLVIYENEGHGIRGREHQRDINRRTVSWFDTYLKAH